MLRRFSLCSAFCFVRTVFNHTRLLRSLSKKEHNLYFFLFLLFFLFLTFFFFSFFFFFLIFSLFFTSFLFYLDSFGHGCSRFIRLSLFLLFPFFLFFFSNSFFPFLDPSNPTQAHRPQRHSDEPFLNHIPQWGFNRGSPIVVHQWRPIL